MGRIIAVYGAIAGVIVIIGMSISITFVADHGTMGMVGDDRDADLHADDDDDARDGAVDCDYPAHDPVSPVGGCHAGWPRTTAEIHRPKG